jgi:hypothetical protein
MAVTLKTLKAGDTLYDCAKERMGNTTMKILRVRTVRIIDVNTETTKALVSWNGNAPEWHHAGYFSSANIRRFPPEWIERFGKEPTCHMCGATKTEGHRQGCKHPKGSK